MCKGNDSNINDSNNLVSVHLSFATYYPSTLYLKALRYFLELQVSFSCS